MSVKFFYDHAGWGYDPSTETPEQGRMRGARHLAAAERLARYRDLQFRWGSELGMMNHVAEYDCYDAEPETCEYCIVADEDGQMLGSLGCIDDATPEYRRVIEAELALEALESLSASKA